MNLSHTSWSNPLDFNHSTTSSKLHSVGCVFFNCEGEVANGGCGGVCITCGACVVAAGADVVETILVCFECRVLLKCEDDGEGDGRPLATGVP